jgi:hypothetical protein
MEAGENYGGIYGGARAGGSEDEVAATGNLAEPISGVCNYHEVSRVFLDLSEDGTAGFWDDFDSLYAEEGLY